MYTYVALNASTRQVFNWPSRTCANAEINPKISVADHVALNAAADERRMRPTPLVLSQARERIPESKTAGELVANSRYAKIATEAGSSTV